MSSKAQRKRAKRSRSISLPGGESADAPTSQGMRPPQEDPRKVAQEARGRVLGYPKSKDAKQAVLAPMRGSQAGCCIDAIGSDKALLWQAWQDICAAQRNYRMRVLGVTGEPKCASIGMIPDAMQADQGLTIDIRSPSERDEAARRGWMAWEARIKALPAPQMIWAIKGAIDGGIDGQGGNLWRDGQPTDRGRVFVAALGVLTS